MNNIKNNTIIIKAGKGYPPMDGFEVVIPYKEWGLASRILRELCFRLPFLPKKIWYNDKIKGRNLNYILINDPLITIDFLNWLSDLYPRAQLNFVYDNLVGNARHLLPSQIPSRYRIWSYDRRDCEKYGLRLYPTTYCVSNVKPLKTPEYDVLFIGRDKGRAQFLLRIEKEIKKVGLKPYFIITKDGRFSKNHKYYKKLISYSEVLELVTKSRSILNVVMPDQVGLTLRDMESLFFGVKLVTTNEEIIKADFYNPNNIFVLKNIGDIVDLPQFLNLPVSQVDKSIKQAHQFEETVIKITEPDDI